MCEVEGSIIYVAKGSTYRPEDSEIFGSFRDLTDNDS